MENRRPPKTGKGPVQTFLLLGGNEGDVAATFRTVLERLAETVGRIVCASSLYETAPWGNPDQPNFLNRALIVETRLPPQTVLRRCLDIEKKLGRKRSVKNAARTIDIDILFYDSAVLHDEGLDIPHPRIAHRRFVLVPLNEIAPGFVHPGYQKTVQQLLSECQDVLEVKKL